MQTEKPILAIDYGQKRIGLAISDSKGIIASPLDVLRITDRHGVNKILEDILLIVDEYRVKSILIGMPQQFEYSYSKSINKIKSFAKKLADMTDKPIIFQDESYSTTQAQNMLLSLGQSTRSSKGKIDKIGRASCRERV